ncbi:MAG TPA: 50S ribosomal protein L25 [Tepidisphaeraceae bacterium]|jgi:large subunit ribosomal protein L25|nr:50S ribosomal protein L25 [Tepidisphaeraceae bacterium]
MATQTAQVTARERKELGSRANKRLRDQGFIPGVVYGHKEAVIPVTLPKKELSNHLGHGTHLFDLALEGKSEKVLVKEVQYDHLGLEIIHVDFARVSLDEKVEVTVPLELKGTPKGEEEGGVLQQILSQLEIECLVTDIPEVIRHNVSDMAKDSVLHISDLKLPPGVRVLQDGDLIVATVKEVLEAAPVEVVEAAATEPEVIGRKPTEEEAAAAPAGEAEKK